MRQRTTPRSGRVGLIAAAAALALAASSAPLAATAADDCARVSASVNDVLSERFGTYGDTAGRWTGADSAYSVPLPDGGIAWIYSDTFLGEVDDAHGRPLDSPFVHNSIIIDRAGELTTYTGGTAAAPTSLVHVEGGDESQNWYWFGDATVSGDQLHVMLLEFERTGDGMWDFGFAGSAVATFDLDGMRLVAIDQVPSAGVQWGSAIYENADDGYTYVYGVEDLQSQKFAHLARVPAGGITTQPWQYLAEDGWSADPSSSKRVLEGVSNEFSVSHYQGRFTRVTGDATEALSASIVMYRSERLEGPFTGKTELYRTPETSGNVFTYNAKAHPELGNGHSLMVTYNVNSFDTNDLYAEVDNYRPRYVDIDAKVRNGQCPS
jgi:hypothetical protein